MRIILCFVEIGQYLEKFKIYCTEKVQIIFLNSVVKLW